ncbi:MAG: hypothetical protein PWQ87_706 [Candidatus Woesearchaeota archaeon]|nr:hypothetical protein [Candidatus Woesearchaeota archaeon]
MAELKVVAPAQTIEYSGLFIADELYHVIDSWLKENNYTKEEKKASEKVHEDSKDVLVKCEAVKPLNETTNYVLKIDLVVRNMIALQIEDKGNLKRFNKGDVSITLEGVKVADKTGKWEIKPFYFFLRTAFHKFILKDEEERMDSIFKRDYSALKNEILNYLNMHKYLA